MLAVATDAGIASGAQLGLEASSCCARGRQADFRIHRPFMPYIQLNDSQYPLFVGETHVGRGVGADILIPGSEAEETELIAVVTLGDDHAATIAGASDTFPVKVNGIVLGREASPLQHGDRIELAGVQLRFADELQGMITHPMPTVPLATGVPPVQRTGEAALTGGRLISLTDGREYRVGDGSITIGRDAGCDVVVAVTEVSRRHARIEPDAGGYVLIDTSTNGVLLNGERVQSRASLGRHDTIRVGSEEFRFHAEPVLPPTPPASAGATAGRTQGPAAEVATAARRPVLATLEVINEGPAKGQRFDLTTPLSHIGRGTHNDVPIPDESVSDLHAKVQLREDGWYVVDMGSTNGTYVGGERVSGEARLHPNVDLRFGGMKFLFRAKGGAVDAPHGTRVIVGLKGADPVRAAADATRAPMPRREPTTEPIRLGIPPFILIAVIVLAIVVAIFILQGA